MTLLFPIVEAHEIDVADANRLLVRWGHVLGACRRPFEQRAHAFFLEQDPIAVTVSASTVSSTCGGDPRVGLVELARICRRPDERWVTRPMLRLWREVFAREWRSWPVSAVVSYATPGCPGHIYRHDGWERVGVVNPSAGGGTWSNAPAVNQLADGVKTLWRYRFPTRAPSPVDAHDDPATAVGEHLGFDGDGLRLVDGEVGFGVGFVSSLLEVDDRVVVEPEPFGEFPDVADGEVEVPFVHRLNLPTAG